MRALIFCSVFPFPNMGRTLLLTPQLLQGQRWRPQRHRIFSHRFQRTARTLMMGLQRLCGDEEELHVDPAVLEETLDGMTRRGRGSSNLTITGRGALPFAAHRQVKPSFQLLDSGGMRK